MRDCAFTIEFSGNADALVRKAKAALDAAGGTLDGDARSGDFAVKAGMISVSGSYQVEGTMMAVSITKKPVMLTCGRIEKEVRKYLLGS